MAESEIELLDVKELHEKRENDFSRMIALVTSIFAVILAITSLGANEAMKEMILAQQQASDQWAFYQAKSIRQTIYQSQIMVLQASENPAKHKNLINSMNKDIARYKAEKNKIEEEAKSLEKERNTHRTKNIYFEYGTVLLQIAIVLSSISILARSHKPFFIAVIIAGIGLISTINGYFLIYPK